MGEVLKVIILYLIRYNYNLYLKKSMKIRDLYARCTFCSSDFRVTMEERMVLLTSAARDTKM